MIIQEMERREALEMLASGRLARLACVDQGMPFLLPVSLVFKIPPEGEPCFLYGVTTVGRKIRAMRSNPAVCVEMDDVRADDDWECVIVEGRFEELPRPQAGANHLRTPRPPSRPDPGQPAADPAFDPRQEAYEALAAQAMWWEPAATAWRTRPDRDPDVHYEPVYYRIWAEVISGRRGRPGPSR